MVTEQEMKAAQKDRDDAARELSQAIKGGAAQISTIRTKIVGARVSRHPEEKDSGAE